MSADGTKFFPFVKGERSNFSLFERKVTKEANQHAVGLPVGMEVIYRKARWSLRERLRGRRSVRLPKTRRFSDATRFFVELRYVGKLFFWCADGTASPPRANFIPTKCGKITALHPSKAYWGLNKMAGIFADPSMHHARSARLPYTLYGDKAP